MSCILIICPAVAVFGSFVLGNACHLWIRSGITDFFFGVLSPSFPRFYVFRRCYKRRCFPNLFLISSKEWTCFLFFLCFSALFVFIYIILWWHRDGRRGTSPNGSDDDGSGRWTASGCYVDRLASALLHAPIRRYDDAGFLGNARPR